MLCRHKRSTHRHVLLAQSAYGDSPLTLLAAKTELTSAEILTQRRMAVMHLIEDGVDFGLPNGEGLTAIQVACRDGASPKRLSPARKRSHRTCAVDAQRTSVWRCCWRKRAPIS